MEAQKIANLLGDADNESSKFATRKWYVINYLNNTNYDNDATVKFETKVIKSNPCDYSDAYILVTWDITVVNGDDSTKVAFKNCAPCTKCTAHVNNEHIHANDLDIVMPTYNLIEYNDNYSGTSGSLRQIFRNAID